jgi:limonene 1,2-monooxygenase
MTSIRFGAFVAPFHAHQGQNPTLALHRDVETVQLLDRLGFDEAWFGEHHSGATEIIASPEIFCAYAAPLTRRIKLGTGAVSLPYHNPLWVAERAILLDHLTRGRFMLGIGPGILNTDATMIGLDPKRLRDHLQADLPVLLHLLRSDEPISVRTDRYELVDARCQLDPATDFEIALTSMMSTNGPMLAGRHGLGLLQLSGLTHEGMQVLPEHLEVMAGEAARAGRVVDDAGLRVVGIMHLAETREQAVKDVEFGLDDYFAYTQDVIGGGAVAGRTFASRLEWVMDQGRALIGTPADAIERLDELVEVTGGRVGAFLHWAQEWASPQATNHSYELFARHVMPAFQGTTRRLDLSRTWAIENRDRLRALSGAGTSPAHG